MEVGLKNAIILHATNLNLMATKSDHQFGKYSEHVRLLFEIAKAVSNGLKNEVDPDVLMNSIESALGISGNSESNFEIQTQQTLNSISEYHKGILDILQKVSKDSEDNGKGISALVQSLAEVVKSINTLMENQIQISQKLFTNNVTNTSNG